jgi:hypothetical protein
MLQAIFHCTKLDASGLFVVAVILTFRKLAARRVPSPWWPEIVATQRRLDPLVARSRHAHIGIMSVCAHQNTGQDNHASVQGVHVLDMIGQDRVVQDKTRQGSHYQQQDQNAIGRSNLSRRNLIGNQGNHHGVHDVQSNHLEKGKAAADPKVVIGGKDLAHESNHGTSTAHDVIGQPLTNVVIVVAGVQ